MLPIIWRTIEIPKILFINLESLPFIARLKFKYPFLWTSRELELEEEKADVVPQSQPLAGEGSHYKHIVVSQHPPYQHPLQQHHPHHWHHHLHNHHHLRPFHFTTHIPISIQFETPRSTIYIHTYAELGAGGWIMVMIVKLVICDALCMLDRVKKKTSAAIWEPGLSCMVSNRKNLHLIQLESN